MHGLLALLNMKSHHRGAGLGQFNVFEITPPGRDRAKLSHDAMWDQVAD